MVEKNQSFGLQKQFYLRLFVSKLVVLKWNKKRTKKKKKRKEPVRSHWNSIEYYVIICIIFASSAT